MATQWEDSWTANLLLQTDSDDGGSLAAVQRWPVSHVSPGCHRELTAVLVAHDLLLPGQTNQGENIGNVITERRSSNR